MNVHEPASYTETVSAGFGFQDEKRYAFGSAEVDTNCIERCVGRCIGRRICAIERGNKKIARTVLDDHVLALRTSMQNI